MQGFVNLDLTDDYETARNDLARWVRSGAAALPEDILDGLDKAPDAIAWLYLGENLGKRLIRVRPEAAPAGGAGAPR